MFYQKKRNLIVEEKDVTTVVMAINRHQGFFSNNNKKLGACGWAKEPSKWYVSFNASDREWGLMTGDLSKLGEITVRVTPGDTTELYFMRKGS